MSTEATLFIGRRLEERWLVLEELGGGGFGLVFAAQDLHHPREVAVKVLRLSHNAHDGAKTEFRDETRILEALRACDCVVDIIASGTDLHILNGRDPDGNEIPITFYFPYIILELADGCLTDLLAVSIDSLPWKDRLSVYRDAVRGIHQMHIRQIVNRDLKSENVLLFAPAHSLLRAKVADMGRARITTEPARFLPEDYLSGRGDLRFAAPELLWHQGRDTDRSWRAVDLYHLGSLLYELTTGVGLTSVVLPDSLNMARQTSSMTEAERASSFKDFLPELRDRYEHAYSLFGQASPPVLRDLLVRTLRQLTDPDPMQRFPRPRGVIDVSPGLGWLLRRVDIAILTSRNAERQARRESERKASVA